LRRVRVSAHWRKAPYALVHHRSVLLAVFVAALLAALASSSAPFVTTAVASEALKNKLADLSPYATGLQIWSARALLGSESAAQLRDSADEHERTAAGLRQRIPHLRPPLFTYESGPLLVSAPGGGDSVRLLARTDALEHVRVLAKTGGSGIWISDITAHSLRAKPGDTIRLEGLRSYSRPRSPRVRVKGIYEALAHTAETDYWGNLYQEIYPRTLDADVPPPYALVRPDQLFGLFAGYSQPIEQGVELPVDPKGMTLAQARSLDKRFTSVRGALRSSTFGQKLGCTGRTVVAKPCTVISSLSAAVVLADRNASAVTPAVTLLSELGTGIALAVAAAAGAFLVRRRRAEAALLYARGEHAGVFAARSALEVLAPALAGGAAGFALALGLIDVFAPSGSVSGGTVWSGVWHGAAAAAIAVCLLVACATLSFLRLYDTAPRGPSRLRLVPWELIPFAAAAALLVRIMSEGAISTGRSSAHVPTLAVFVFPLLLVTAVAGAAARVVRAVLATGFGRPRRRPASVYLALRRLAAGRGLVVVLAVVSAASLGSFFYIETLAESLSQTTTEKAYIATGSDANAIVSDAQQIPRSFPYPVSRVQFANQAASSPNGTWVDVMLVDPETLARTLHWQRDWGSNPAGALRRLQDAASQPLPAIVTSDLSRRDAIVISGRRIPMRTLAVVDTFPFVASGIPLVITTYRALHDLETRTQLYGSLGVLATYAWGKGPPADVGRALASLQPAYPPATINTFLRNPDVLVSTRTFGFMRLIAAGAGVLALVGLLLYLQARQRSQAIASTLARRMGFGRSAETLSLCLELAAILAFAAVVGGGVALAAAVPIVHRIDPLPDYPPSPLFTVPLTEIVIAAAVLFVLAGAAGALTSWLARRADVAEALRVA
jgi:putative ABC transport system permease protein